MLDSDLAELYQVSTKRLNEQVKRNRERFPKDFMFQLAPQEVESLRSQFATSNRGRGGRRYRPYGFTEHGAVMLASVLNSPVAVQASIQVVRAFVKLREMLATHRELGRKLAQLEKRIEGHDEEITAIFQAIRQLMGPPEKPKKRIGFRG
jgi:phage regulator Rha-like protein